MTEPRRRIFYAPTWEGFFEDSCYCSLIVMGQQIAAVLAERREQIVVDFKPHPLTGNYDRRYRDAQDAFASRIHELGIAGTVMAPDRHIYDYFRECDLMIADVSSVVSDFLYLGRPIVLTNPLAVRPMTRRFPVARGCYVLHPDPFGLGALLDDALGADSLREARMAMRAHILGVAEGQSAQSAFEAALSRIAREQERPDPGPPAAPAEVQVRWMAEELERMLRMLVP